MMEILGKKYINDKEAASRYGYSRAWFRLSRHKKTGPKFARLSNGGRIWYPLEETDNWFKEKLQAAI